jgi:competence protein ComEC
VLAVAIVVVVIADPEAVTAVGAWLSAAAVWGTGAAGAVLPAGRRGPVWRLIASSVGATLATAPITAYAFGAVAPVGVVANLVAVPLASVAVPAVFGSVAVGALAPGAGLVLGALERIAAVGAAVPGGNLAADPGVRFAIPWAVGLAVAIWWYRRRPTWAVVGRRLLTTAAVVAWVAVVAGARGGDRPFDGVTIHVLAVGQGDAIAIRTPKGRWVLVDGGPRLGGSDAGARVVVPFLRRHGVRALAALVVSHGDADHLGGVPAVLTRVPTALVLEPGQPLASELYREYLSTVDRTGVAWRAARAGDTLSVDGVTLAVLHPGPAWMRRETRPNENSVVVRLSFGAFDVLLTGDVGVPVEAALAGAVGQVEVLKVGHHGSAGSTGPAWLAEVQPKVAVVSVGARNRYGHPAPDVLARLATADAAVYRTDTQGAVTIRSDGRYFTVIHGSRGSLRARVLCRVRDWLPSRASSSSKSACTRRPRASSPTSYTTWPSPPR